MKDFFIIILKERNTKCIYFKRLRAASPSTSSGQSFVETKNLPALPTGRQAAGRDGVDEVIINFKNITVEGGIK